MRVGRVIRLGERARISLFAEGFNLFNRSNVALVNNTQYAVLAAINQTPPLPSVPLRLGPAASNFGTPRQFLSGSPSFSLNNSSYNREFQLGIRLDF